MINQVNYYFTKVLYEKEKSLIKIDDDMLNDYLDDDTMRFYIGQQNKIIKSLLATLSEKFSIEKSDIEKFITIDKQNFLTYIQKRRSIIHDFYGNEKARLKKIYTKNPDKLFRDLNKENGINLLNDLEKYNLLESSLLPKIINDQYFNHKDKTELHGMLLYQFIKKQKYKDANIIFDEMLNNHKGDKEAIFVIVHLFKNHKHKMHRWLSGVPTDVQNETLNKMKKICDMESQSIIDYFLELRKSADNMKISKDFLSLLSVHNIKRDIIQITAFYEKKILNHTVACDMKIKKSMQRI